MKLSLGLSSALCALAIVSVATTARADLVGQTILGSGTGLYTFTEVPHTGSATIGPGIEFIAIPCSPVYFDFDASTLTITTRDSLSWGEFGPYVFSGFSEPIVAVTMVSNFGFKGGITTPTFTADSITIDMTNGESIYGGPVGLVFEIQTQTASVPDGGITAGLLGVALVGMAVLRRRFTR
jgi:hypothetical protein